VPLVAAEVVDDLLGNQDRRVVLDDDRDVVADDLLGTGLRARAHLPGKDR
jgi:hypothetical protein